MAYRRIRAVVLAAGHGRRLRPLTAELPKPLLPILGRPLLAETLDRLAAFGVEATAINLHHQADAIPAALGEHWSGMPLHYSREREILGTLGALHPLRDFLALADLVLVVNGDSLCQWPFAELVERHLATGALATLLLSATADATAFGGIAVDASGRVVGVPTGVDHAPPAARRVFMGAHVLAPALVREAPARFSDSIRDLYRPQLAAGAHLDSVTSAAPWHDLGTPARYLDAVLQWAALDDPTRAGSSWIAAGARVAAGAAVAGSVVETGAAIEAGVSCSGSLVLDGARVGRASRLERALIAPAVEIPESSVLENALVTPPAWGLAASSAVGGALVITPLDAVAAGTAR
jgi:NDP-sugar pyrophosphorylase family protein